MSEPNTNVSELLKDVDFPISKQDLISQYGNEQIIWSKDEVVSLKEVIEDVDTECFNSSTELEDLLTK